MTDWEKLVDLMRDEAIKIQNVGGEGYYLVSPTKLADRLLANGVTVLPQEDYYVLRNVENGMYFRGKGANRWGNRYNQATIYRLKKVAENSIKEAAWHGEKVDLVKIKILELPELPKGECP